MGKFKEYISEKKKSDLKEEPKDDQIETKESYDTDDDDESGFPKIND